MKQLKITIFLFILLMVIVAVIYPLLITSLAELFFPWQAEGSLIRNSKGAIIGSALIGQPFSNPEYFWSRPSATAEFPYNPLASGGSNLGPTNEELIREIYDRVISLRSSNGMNRSIPSELVMASGSGLDPHISLESALAQIPRVARSRGVDEERLRNIVLDNLEGRMLGFLGEPRINVLTLNLELDGFEVSSHVK
ncbi:MAG: potassium-transporting ATPase subunit KdpC [Thermodesulfobacteriota bacterium]